MIFSKFRLTRLWRFRILPLVAGLTVSAGWQTARAATISSGDVTTSLGPSFFVDDATNGGDDTDINQPNAPSYDRYLTGLLTRNQGPTRVTLTGLGFAAHTSATANDATTLAVTFTYLGADDSLNGGDDVLIGTATGTYIFTVGGEYVFAFDTPLTADLIITGTRFRIQIAPTNTSGTGSLKLKTGALVHETFTGAKLSVAGIVAPQRLNLAKFQTVTTDSVDGQRLASYVTDGNAGNDNRWQSSGSGPHWARVNFPFPVEVGSAQVFTGFDDTNAQAGFRIQYLDGVSWVDAPGAVITGNADAERNIVFTNPVIASSFRVYSTDGTLRIRELALYPSNGVSGFPIGTDVRLNLAQQRPVVANANTSGNFALLAVDGRVNKDSKWQTSMAGANSLEIDLIVSTKSGSAHLYSGSPGVTPLADFVLKYWDGAAWLDIPGGNVTGNTTADLALSFTTPVTTTKVRLEFTNPGTTSVRELCIFPANNGNSGYPIGMGVTGVPPSSAEFDDFTDSFYQINNPAAGLFIAVGGSGQPALSQPGLTTAQGQYQIILNISTGTYRLRNRATGNCLSGAELSKTPGLPLADSAYSALPHQDWILDPLDGGAFQLINQWSGLAVDIQGGGTAEGTALVQNTVNGSASQRWIPEFSAGFPKKGVGGGSFVNSFNADWMYGWGLTTSASLPAGSVFHPMQWGNYNWTYNTSASSTWKLYPIWRANSEPLQLMGFNEPDAYSQSGNSLDTENTNQADFSSTRSMEKAVELWPRLQAMDLPLVAPCPVSITNGWLADFYTRANAQGYRVDYTGKHSYGSPGNGSADGLINGVLEGYTLWGKPMWLTEFSFVDWGGTSSWSEEDCYNCMAEFLWRAESLSWLRKYALFVFTEDANNPQPANPWQDFTPAPRSNSRDINGNLTAFGKLYAAWDNDAGVRTDKAYYIHNKNTRKRLANLLATGPNARSIRVDDNSPRWTLVSTGASNQYYLVSSRDGRRLSYASSAITLAAASTTGTAVEWSLTANQHGWYYLNHPATSTRLQLAYNNTTSTATFTMVANTNTGDAGKWRFIVPPPPQPPPAWAGTNGTSWATAGNWSPSAVPATGDDVSFDSSSTANLATVLNQDFNLMGVNVTTPSAPVSIAGTHTLTVGANGIDLSAASQNLTITAPVILSAVQSWNAASGRTLSINGGVSGAFALSIGGVGSVSLGAAVNPLVPITITSGGTLKMGASTVLGSGASALNPAINGTLDLNGTSQSINGLSGTGILDNTAAGTAQITVGNNDTAVTLSTLIQDSGGALSLVKVGTGSLSLSGTNTFSGGFINNGTGSITSTNPAGINPCFGTGPVVANAGTLYLTTNSWTFNNALTLNGATLRVGGGAGKSVSWAGPVSVTADSIIQCDGSTAGITLSGSVTMNGFTLSSAPNGTANTISGPISGSGTIMAATYTNGILNLNAANSFSGTFRSALGTLRIGDALAMQNGTLDMNAADSGGVNLNNLSATIGALTGSRNLTLGSGTISIGNNHLSTVYSGVLSGSGSLVKTGNGTLSLSGANLHTGSTSVNGGTLAMGASNVLPGTAVSIGNATLDVATFTDTVGTLDVTSNATINLGTGAVLAFADSSAVSWTGGSLHITGTFTPGASLRFGISATGLTSTQLGLITVNGGTGPFTLNSAGFLSVPITDPYDTWKTQITNGQDGRTQDAEGDGFTNLQEFLFGTSPIVGNGSLVSLTASGNNIVLRWLQRESGASYTLMQSATLAGGSWITAVQIPSLDGNQTGAPSDYDYHTVTIPTGGSGLFYRIEGAEN